MGLDQYKITLIISIKKVNSSLMHIHGVRAIDLFCGTGGLSFGLLKGGIDICAGIDNALSCEWPYKTNIKAKFVGKSVTDITCTELKKLWGDGNSARLLAGCAPCQPFSSQRRGKDTSHEKSWPLLLEFLRLVKGTLPEYVTMENVPNIARSNIFRYFRNGLEDKGYNISYGIMYGPNYGLPQARKRLVLIAGLNRKIIFPSPIYQPAQYRTVRDAISDLPSIESGGKDPHDSLHFARKMTHINIARAKASIPGGTWHDWPESLRLPCQKKPSGESFTSFYGRMCWDKPSPTITTQFFNSGAGRFTHPEENRALTPREAARLQGFPDSFKFIAPGEKVNLETLGRLIGNAVPPIFGQIVAKQILQAEKRRLLRE